MFRLCGGCVGSVQVDGLLELARSSKANGLVGGSAGRGLHLTPRGGLGLGPFPRQGVALPPPRPGRGPPRGRGGLGPSRRGWGSTLPAPA